MRRCPEVLAAALLLLSLAPVAALVPAAAGAAAGPCTYLDGVCKKNGDCCTHLKCSGKKCVADGTCVERGGRCKGKEGLKCCKFNGKRMDCDSNDICRTRNTPAPAPPAPPSPTPAPPPPSPRTPAPSPRTPAPPPGDRYHCDPATSECVSATEGHSTLAKCRAACTAPAPPPPPPPPQPPGPGFGPTGNPDGECTAGVPARGRLADTSKPATVVGSGTAGSCTFAALRAAVSRGGVITFDCGPAVATIAVTATMNLPTDKDTVIDGGGKVILHGGDAHQILNFNHPDWLVNDHGLTLQRVALVHGKQTPTKRIPKAPAPCSQGWNDGEGGALYIRDGYLNVVECLFSDNAAAPRGPDTGGGAIYVLGSKGGAVVARSTFTRNAASNAAAIGGLFAPLAIYGSLFTNNTALGDGANADDPQKCKVINNNQHEVGSGGNGGAIYSDGNDVDVTLCGDAVLDNHAGAGAFGGGLFFTSNNMGGTLRIADSTITGNTGGHWTDVDSGAVKDVGTAIGVNCKRITLTNSTLQGVPRRGAGAR